MKKDLFYKHQRIIRDFLQENQLWDQPLLLAISGGIDSVYLAQMLITLDQKVSFAHINYHLRGSDAFVDEQFVKSLGERNEVPVYVRLVDMPMLLKAGGNMQVMARDLRYMFFKELVEEHGFSAVLTAHHRKDQVETIIRNFIHGAGLSGLIGIPKENQKVFRPILDIPEEEIREIMEYKEWKWREDHTNLETEYDRNYIRHKIIPKLGKLNPNVEERIVHTSSLLKEANWIVDDYVHQFLDKYFIEEEVGIYHIEKRVLEDHPAINTILYYICKQKNIKESMIPELEKLLYAQTGANIVLPHLEIWNDRDVLLFKNKEKINAYDITIEEVIDKSQLFEPVYIDYLNCNIELRLISPEKDIIDFVKENTVYLNTETIEWPICLRTWREGDRMQPFGMEGSKKISRLFIDEKIPSHEKPTRVIVADQKGVLGVLGLKMSERSRIFLQTKEVLQIYFSTKEAID